MDKRFSSSLEYTNHRGRYIQADSEQQRKALESVYEDVLPQVNNEHSWKKNFALKEFLKGLG